MEEDHFDYFNRDLNLLALHILLEGFYRGQNVFTLDQFLKGNYWKIDEIKSEITDTNDHGSVEHLVLHQVFDMIEVFSIGKIRRLSVINLSDLLERAVREAVMTENPTDENVGYYTYVFGEIYDLKKMSEARLDAAINDKEKKFDFKNDFPRMRDRIDFASLSEAAKSLSNISDIAAPHIEFELTFIDAEAKKLNEKIADFLASFAADDFVDKPPIYKKKRSYFSKQLENFYKFVKELPLIDGSVNIPFTSLANEDFEVIKVLSYLEQEGRLKVRNWNDKELWNVKFHSTPITLSSLTGQEKMASNTINTAESEEIKLNLSFQSQSGMLILTDQDAKEHKIRIQGQVQKEVLRVIFDNPKNTYSDWSLGEISEMILGDDVDDTAVKNAIYQFNRKVKLHIPQVENLFELTKHSARLNPKYVVKN